MNYLAAYRFIREAFEGSGGFAPGVATHLIRYPREDDDKYAARCELAWYENLLAPACARFAGYLSVCAPDRDLPHIIYEAMADDVDGQGNAIDVFWSHFAMLAKAFGCMLLLVDGPRGVAASLSQQLDIGDIPRFRAITPDRVSSFAMSDDGQFDSVSFYGMLADDIGDVDVTWTFTRTSWQAERDGRIIAGGAHGLGANPVLIFSESGQFPRLGSFSQIAYLSRRLYNMQSELDEILRTQTFSVLAYQVPPDLRSEFSGKAGEIAETIGTHNMLVHHGITPAFIAPPDGPATVYQAAIDRLVERMNEIGLKVTAPNAQESGLAMQYRFQALNSSLGDFSWRMADLERRAWDLARKWCGLSVAPVVTWPRKFDLADISTELDVLERMQTSGMPDAAIRAQQRRVVSVQFGGSMEQGRYEEVMLAIDEGAHERQPAGGDAA